MASVGVHKRQLGAGPSGIDPQERVEKSKQVPSPSDDACGDSLSLRLVNIHTFLRP